MHLSTFATRHIVAGWVIDATKADGQVEQLVGVYLRKKDAIVWMAEHTAEGFRLQQQIKAGARIRCNWLVSRSAKCNKVGWMT